MNRTLDEINMDVEAHIKHDEERFEMAHELLNRHHENALKIEKHIENIKENHLTHIEADMRIMQVNMGKMAQDLGWMKWFLVPIAIPVIDAISKIIKSYL